MNEHQRVLENEVIDMVLARILQAGWNISVHDGEEVAVRKSKDAEKIKKELNSTETGDTLYVYDDDGRNMGWVTLIYGQSGWDVVQDYSPSLTKLLKPILNYIVRKVKMGPPQSLKP